VSTSGPAAWSPDGKKLAFADHDGLFIARGDGTAPGKLATSAEGQITEIIWAPDGTSLRFVPMKPGMLPSGFWEVAIGTGRVTKKDYAWTGGGERFGHWSPDGKYFLFSRCRVESCSLWAVREDRIRLPWQTPAPVPLTADLSSVTDAVPSLDGKRIYSISASTPRAEVWRYEPSIQGFAPDVVMTGISAGHVQYSPDRKWVAYVTHPESELWVMRTDGSSKRRLVATPHQAALPQWSPDGRQIAFMGWEKGNGHPSHVFLVVLESGAVRQIPETSYWQGVPVWSSDGNLLIFGENTMQSRIPESCHLHSFDLRTAVVADLPNTRGLWTPRTNPAGPLVAALSPDKKKLVLYNVRTTDRTELYAFPDGAVFGDNPTWSHDGRSIYFDNPWGRDPAIYRLRLTDRYFELVASLKSVNRTHGDVGAWIGLTPDEKVMVLRQLATSEIYSFDWADN